MALMMFSLLKTYEQVIWVLFGPVPYLSYHVLTSHSDQVFLSEAWLSEILKFYHWVQEGDSAFLKMDIGAETRPTN